MANPTSPEESGTQREKTGSEKRMENPLFQALMFGIGLALYILLGLVLWWILDWYINPQNPTQKKDLVQALGLIMAGVAGAIGIYFTWRGQRITQRAQEENQRNTQAQLRTTQEELSLTREGQITERFTRAIEHLGNDSLEIRLGGIYALERIARDSPERDYSTVIEVLTAYVRENAPWPPKPSKAPEASPESPPTDIQAILDVFKRLGEEGVSEKDDRALLDLRGTDLRGANLGEVHLEGANLVEAHLEGADLVEAHLEGANLVGARLEGADLTGAHLEKAKLDKAHLEDAYLRDVHLEDAWLPEAHLEKAKLHKAHLEDAWLPEAHLEGTYLYRAHLEGANLREAIRLTQAQINAAYGDEVTVLPKGLVRPAHWSKSNDEQPNGEE